MAAFTSIIDDILINNLWGCTSYELAGVTIPGVSKVSESLGKVIYENNEARTVGPISNKAPTPCQKRMYKWSPGKKGLFLCKRCYLEAMQRFSMIFMVLQGTIVLPGCSGQMFSPGEAISVIPGLPTVMIR